MEINTIFNEDCFDTMNRMNNKFLDIIITSPPYNENKEYDKYKDNLKLKDWIDFIKRFLEESQRVLKDDGRICLNLAESNRSPLIPKPHIVSNLMFEMGFLLRGHIIWHKPGYKGCAWGSWQSPSNPTITDNSEYIIVASNRQLKKRGKKENIDITRDEFKEWITGHWNITPSSDKNHPCIFPKELPRRCMKLYSFQNDIVYDPFLGIGTTAIVAKENNRNFIGSELSKTYHDIALEKTKDKLADTLFVR